MKHIRLSIIILFTMALTSITGWLVGVYSESRVHEQVLQTLERAEQAYLFKRFQTAYKGMEPTVAIWEGTNLIAFLKESQTNELASKEELASKILLNSRLSSLFKEIARNNEANYFAQEAFTLLHKLDRSTAYTADEVVEKTLAAESVKRHYIKVSP